MKKLFKKIVPVWLLQWYKKRKSVKFANKSARETFTEIYNTNHWKSSESISGTGSEIAQTEALVKELSKLLKDMNVSSVLDIPCGDFRWMQNVDLSNVRYIGADIVEALIINNIEKYKGSSNLTFKVLDLINDPLPKSDLIIVRDCFVHLSYDDIFKAIKNIKLSGCKYLLTTTFINHHSNFDIVTGDWRKLNFQEKPFTWTKPIVVINENCTEGDGDYRDKTMALWAIDEI